MVAAMKQTSDPGSQSRPVTPQLRLAGGLGDAAPAPGQPAPASAAITTWSPSDAIRGSQWARIAASIGATAAFAAWMVYQWNSRALRLAGAAFALVTGYLAYRVIADDLHRRRLRQVRLLHGALYVTSSDGTSVIALDQVVFAQWRSDMDAASGLWFFDRDKKVMAHLNTDFLADSAQARALLSWAAGQHAFSFEVRWS
jgi:hypothetical protein